MNTPQIDFLRHRKTSTSRYTEVIYVPKTRVNWELIAQDIKAAATAQLDRALAAVNRKVQPIVRRVQVAGMAAAVGIAVAVQTYQLLA